MSNEMLNFHEEYSNSLNQNKINVYMSNEMLNFHEEYSNILVILTAQN
jgi:hypothetical protein